MPASLHNPIRRPTGSAFLSPRSPLEAVRGGAIELHLENSGRDVWLYDEANLEALRAPGVGDPGDGGRPADLVARTAAGLVVGYELPHNVDVYVAVLVGEGLTSEELAAAFWLEPQTAWLRLPSGALCVESNDLSRVGPVTWRLGCDPVRVPPGDYGVTLHRIDYDAFELHDRVWRGPDEVILLTRATPPNPAHSLLEFPARHGRRSHQLA
jgi:hypothetical protein